jgi:hypothetical protein
MALRYLKSVLSPGAKLAAAHERIAELESALNVQDSQIFQILSIKNQHKRFVELKNRVQQQGAELLSTQDELDKARNQALKLKTDLVKAETLLRQQREGPGIIHQESDAKKIEELTLHGQELQQQLEDLNIRLESDQKIFSEKRQWLEEVIRGNQQTCFDKGEEVLRYKEELDFLQPRLENTQVMRKHMEVDKQKLSENLIQARNKNEKIVKEYARLDQQFLEEQTKVKDLAREATTTSVMHKKVVLNLKNNSVASQMVSDKLREALMIAEKSLEAEKTK